MTAERKKMLLAAAAVAVIVFAYLRNHGAAAASSSGVDPNAIDPQTGLTYAQEAAAAASGSSAAGGGGSGAGDSSAAFDQLNQNEQAILQGLQQLGQGEADLAASIAEVGATLATGLPAPAAPAAPAPTPSDPSPAPATAPAPAPAPAPARPVWGPPVKVNGVPNGFVIVTAKGGVAVTPQVQQALAAPPKPSKGPAPKAGFVVVA